MRPSLAVALIALAVGSGCQATSRGGEETQTTVSARPPANTNIGPNRIPYVDTDAFDTVFESALIHQDPLIIVQTQETKPEWGPRLNAWIAAWNAGARPPRARRGVRGQIPTGPVTISGDSVREFRFLIDDLLDRVDSGVRGRSTWWAEERIKSRRIALLQPYNLRFHMDALGQIQLCFFHGAYATQYPDVMALLMPDLVEEDGPAGWVRGVVCSRSQDPLMVRPVVAP
jgi:hypothetical protein